MEALYRILFGLLGYVILLTPHLIGLFTYPKWLIFIIAIISGYWLSSWLYDKYIVYKLRKNNPLKKGR